MFSRPGLACAQPAQKNHHSPLIDWCVFKASAKPRALLLEQVCTSAVRIARRQSALRLLHVMPGEAVTQIHFAMLGDVDAVADVAMITANFLPWHALLGGASLGLLSAGKTLITSQVLGISGTVKYAVVAVSAH